ncbi:MAG: ABC transporter permease [Lachnospiraceae bacterium]|nr:ABC transporter permease [Lachnospiraceae bacterium]
MTRGMRTTTVREIRASLGRYLAIAAIIALGVGFFAGLRITTADMIATTDEYLEERKLFDYRLASTIGFTDAELELLRKDGLVVSADGEIRHEILCHVDSDSDDCVMAFHSITHGVNELELVEGRMPEKPDECVVDSRGGAAGHIGEKILISAKNENTSEDADTNSEHLKYNEYTIVGEVFSPIYLNYERGTTELLDGSIAGFVCINREGFASDIYTSLYAVTNNGETIYSDEYDAMLTRTKEPMEALCEKLCAARRESLSEEIRQKVRDRVAEEFAKYGMEVPADYDYPYDEYDNVEYEWYCLDRNTNVGYVCFDNDAHIVEGLATVFPAFFILVAALVCMTTMSRMIEEQRTQIGVMKALGYTARSISAKYIIYSGSAAIVGGVVGFFLGCRMFPFTIWKVYDIMYGFTDKLIYVFDPWLFVFCMAVGVICPVGVTILSILRAMREVPAELIRPRAPKTGKRILLERVPFLWNRLSFLAKVSVRNVVRYRRRFFMMVIGIAGCMALLIAGHGIRDSMTTVTGVQYGKIERYDYSVLLDDMTHEEFIEETKDYIDSTVFLMEIPVTVVTEQSSKDTYVYVPESEEEFAGVVTRTDVDGKELPIPAFGECYVNDKYADQMSIQVGDTVTLRREGKADVTVRVGGIMLNYVGNCMYMTRETFLEITGEEPVFDTCFAVRKDGTDAFEIGAKIRLIEGVSYVNVVAEFERRIANMLERLDVIVVLVIVCSAALAFIVLYNLTNITITERLREIATIKVLGFRSMETAIYVFRENLMLTMIGAVAGIPLGLLLLRFLMSKIKVDLVSFRTHVEWQSYLYSFLFTLLFALFVDCVMYRRLENIDMAESLKSIE